MPVKAASVTRTPYTIRLMPAMRRFFVKNRFPKSLPHY